MHTRRPEPAPVRPSFAPELTSRRQVPRGGLDVPVGGLRRPRDARLPAQDRLPADLAAPQGGGHHALQRGADGQHAAVQLGRGGAPAAPGARDGGGQPADGAPLRADDEAEPDPRARVRPDRDVRPHHTRLRAARMGRAAPARKVRQHGAPGPRLPDQPPRPRHQAGPARGRHHRRGPRRPRDRRDCLLGQHLLQGLLPRPRGHAQALRRRRPAHGRPGRLAPGREHPDPRPRQGHYHLRYVLFPSPVFFSFPFFFEVPDPAQT